MTGPGSGDEGLDCVVVGGGLAGLACAHGLVTAGRSVTVLEAAEAPGGRARTVWHRGRPVDRGFQALFRAYPQTRALIRAIGLPRRDLRPVSGGAVFMNGAENPRFGASPLAALGFRGMPPADRLRLARLGASVLAAPPAELLARDDEAPTTEAFLRSQGFSEQALQGFFRPFFGVVFQDRALVADPGYFRFLLSMIARGPSVIPSDGLGMIAEWTSAAVRAAGGTVELGMRVEALEPDAAGARVAAVRTADGRRIAARHVVLAVDPPAARRLLEPLDRAAAGRLPDEPASSATAAFALRTPLYRGRVILVNAASGRRDDGPRVDLVCQTTNITRPGAPDGPHIVLATTVTTDGGEAGGLVDAVGRLMARWAPRYDWAGLAEPIGVYEHAFAQYRPRVGVRRELPGPRTAVQNLVLAGDGTTHPSIEGAVSSGVRAAGIVGALLP
ncbi:MAG TPA: NAD(P)/FAD-dependent oxidoreductase [Miltoncostaea sp.]|nr:NAD(P)/FAD-dependent oxidoreductase [Miltoncostaea sp.]